VWSTIIPLSIRPPFDSMSIFPNCHALHLSQLQLPLHFFHHNALATGYLSIIFSTSLLSRHLHPHRIFSSVHFISPFISRLICSDLDLKYHRPIHPLPFTNVLSPPSLYPPPLFPLHFLSSLSLSLSSSYSMAEIFINRRASCNPSSVGRLQVPPSSSSPSLPVSHPLYFYLYLYLSLSLSLPPPLYSPPPFFLLMDVR
jgi:hypothetical protein